MITRVVFEFAVAGGVFPGLADDVVGRRRRPPPPMPPAMPGRIIAVPSKRRVAAFQCWKGTVDPATGCAVEGQGQWEQAPLGDVPSELLMVLAGLLAGAPQPGKPMFMETRVETHHIGDNERGETLTIKLGRIAGEPFEAALPGALLGGGRDARALVSLAAALGVVQDIKAPGWTDAIHDDCIKAIRDLKERREPFEALPSQRGPEPGSCTEHAHNYLSGFATCQCGQATRTGDCRGWKTEARGSELPPMADRYNRTASILRPYDSEGGAGMLPQMAQRVVDALEAARARIADLERATLRSYDRIKQLEKQVDALDHHRKDASRNAAILREIAGRLGLSIPPCLADEWSMKARQTIIDALPALLTQQEWLERIRSALGVEHYSLSIKAIGDLRAALETAVAKECASARDFHDVCEALRIESVTGTAQSEWHRDMRDACIKAVAQLRTAGDMVTDIAKELDIAGIPHVDNGVRLSIDGRVRHFFQAADAARKREGLAVDALRTVSEAFQAVREHMGAPFIPSGPGWAEQTRDACAVAFNQVKADLAAARSDVLGMTKQVDEIMTVGVATYAHEALIKALGYAPGTVPWSRCLELVRETITQRNEARQEAASLASKMFDARKEVDGLRKARAYERNALHQVARALSVPPEPDSTDTMDDCLKAIDRNRHLRMDAEAENRGLREKDAAIAEILTDVQKRAVMNRAGRLDNTLVFAIAEGQAHYSASPHDAIRHATALAFEVRGHRAVAEREADLSRQAGCNTSVLDMSARSEGTLTDEGAVRLHRHLASCEKCRATDDFCCKAIVDDRNRWQEGKRQAEAALDAMVTRAQTAHDAHQVAAATIDQVRALVDAGADRDTVTAVREALAKGAGNAAIVAAIDRLTAPQAEGVALLKRLHGLADLPLQEAGMVPTTATNITAAQIRTLHNSFCDNTATDAARRHLCRIALGECCVSTKGQHVSFDHRYPTEDEIADAKRRLASHWNSSRSSSETATPTGQPQG